VLRKFQNLGIVRGGREVMMMIIAVFVLGLLMFASNAFAQRVFESAKLRKITSLNENWRFIQDDNLNFPTVPA